MEKTQPKSNMNLNQTKNSPNRIRTLEDFATSIEELKDQLSETIDFALLQTFKYIRRHPLQAVLGAFTIGLVAGSNPSLFKRLENSIKMNS